MRIIVRVGGGADAVGRADRAVIVTRWLHSVGYRCSVPVSGFAQPVVVDDDGGHVPVTFWLLVDEAGDAASVTGTQLGHLLKELHVLRPPFTLPVFRPLDRLAAAVQAGTWLSSDDLSWLDQRIDELRRQLDGEQFQRDTGLVHGDAQLGNLIPSSSGAVLGDWDNTAVAPRQWDLVPAAVEYRFGGPPGLLAEVLTAYGSDPTAAAGWSTLCAVYELRSVAAHIRRAPMSPPHAREALLRIKSLRSGDKGVRWSAVG